MTQLGTILRNRSYHLDLMRRVCCNEFYANKLPSWSPASDNKSMYDYWFEYWDNLPDNPGIQQPLFYDICDFMDMLSEGIGNEQPE